MNATNPIEHTVEVLNKRKLMLSGYGVYFENKGDYSILKVLFKNHHHDTLTNSSICTSDRNELVDHIQGGSETYIQNI